jgi:hypothetical protein
MKVAIAMAVANKINKTAVNLVEYRKSNNFFILLKCFLNAYKFKHKRNKTIEEFFIFLVKNC